MGLIKAATSAVSSTLQDQWKKAIRCENLDNETLMIKKTVPDGVISNGSTVIVGPGQCAILYDNGRVIDATAEEGIYTFDSSSSPSFFAGQFGAVFKEMWQRFTYNGATAKQQAVFYFNIKEIIGNKFGTSTPVMYRDWKRIIPNEMTGERNPLPIYMRCYGTYTFRLFDPAMFMSNIAGTADVYKVSQLEEQLHSEVISVFQSVLNELGTEELKINYLDLPSKSELIREKMGERNFDATIKNRGIRIETFAIESVTPSEESQHSINEYDHNSNSRMQQGRVLDVMEVAANNSGGAANGFMGIGMMNMATGGMGSAVMQNAFNPQQTAKPIENKSADNQNAENTTVSSSDKHCSKCGAVVNGKFCSECGTKYEEVKQKFCSNCGAKAGDNDKFCGECGNPLM